MHWRPYTPDELRPWNIRRVAHLHRRAGFAATRGELARDLADGHQAAIDRLLSANAREGVPDDFEATSRLLADAAVAGNNIERLKAWWLFRMLFSPDPLGERLTLLWHNHFATSNRKVADVAKMRRQNDLFRQFARGPFAELLAPVVKDPAVLVWLDADSNRREHPNENLARELMELFTLGVGHYTEGDVKDAARALTGWAVKNQEFRDVPAYHDDGEKTILGQTGNFTGDDLLKLLVEQPATAARLARRLCEWLMGEGMAEEPAINDLAAGLREHHLDMGWAVETVLRSEAFFEDGNIGNRVLSPVEFIVGAVRAFEVVSPPPSTLVLAEWSASLGQNLFEPPNVFGWPGGRAWLTTRSIIGRGNFAARLAEGRLQAARAPPDWLALAERHAAAESVEQFAKFICGQTWSSGDRTEVQRVVHSAVGDERMLTAERARAIVAALLAAPRSQLG